MVFTQVMCRAKRHCSVDSDLILKIWREGVVWILIEVVSSSSLKIVCKPA